MAVDEERALSEAYRTTRRVRAPEGQGLNDLYVRFFRMAERRTAERTGRGVVCFISNHSWLDGNGDKYRTGKVAPDGSPDPSISHGRRSGGHSGWGRRSPRWCAGPITRRRRPSSCASSGGRPSARSWRRPRIPNRPRCMSASNRICRWACRSCAPRSARIGSTGRRCRTFPQFKFPGVNTSRDGFLVDVDRDRLQERMARVFCVGELAGILSSAGVERLQVRNKLMHFSRRVGLSCFFRF